MTRFAMVIDLNTCIGCHACSVACKEAHGTRPGVRRSRVDRTYEGAYPDVRATAYPMLCMHCETAPCVEICPQEATWKRDDGIVVIDKEKCIGCQYCVNACPYGVPKYLEDIQLTHKCDACWTLREKGEDPACVAACPMRALEFGPIDELKAAHPDTVNQITVLPEATQTNPSVAIQAKKAALEKDVAAVLM